MAKQITEAERRQKELAEYNLKRRTIADLLNSYEGEVRKALPSFIRAEQLIRCVLTAATKNPELLNCTPQSIVSAMLTAAQLGLLPDGFTGEAYLSPQISGDKVECQFVPGYRGLSTLALRSGFITNVDASAVWAANKGKTGDVFDWEYGTDRFLKHKRNGLNDVDKITDFYAIVDLKSGQRNFRVKNRAEIEAIRDTAPNYLAAVNKADTFWGKFFAQMGSKTALRELLKYYPVSPELNQAIALDELHELGIKQNTSAMFLDTIKEPALNEAAAVDMIESGKQVKKAKNENKRAVQGRRGQTAANATEKKLAEKAAEKK
jgi:recombination protein RecT